MGNCVKLRRMKLYLHKVKVRYERRLGLLFKLNRGFSRDSLEHCAEIILVCKSHGVGYFLYGHAVYNLDKLDEEIGGGHGDDTGMMVDLLLIWRNTLKEFNPFNKSLP